MSTVAHISRGASQTRTTPDAEFAGNDLFFQTDRGAKRQRKDTGKRMLRCDYTRAQFPYGLRCQSDVLRAKQLRLAGRVTARQVVPLKAKTRVRYTSILHLRERTEG